MRRTLLASALLTILLAASPAMASNLEIGLAQRAEGGDPTAMLEVGRWHLTAPQGDKDKGLYYLERTAQSGTTAAAFANTALGEFYGQKQDAASHSASLRYLRQGAALGDTAAQVQLAGKLFEIAKTAPSGADRLNAQGIMLLEHAATHGNTQAQAELGEAYLYGRGVAPNGDTGRRWLRRAADGGNTQAAFVIGTQMLNVRGSVSYNATSGRRYLEQAARAGHRQAMAALADGLASGADWTRDLPQALAWAKKGLAAGDSTAGARVQRIENAMANERDREPVYAVAATTAPIAPLDAATSGPLEAILTGTTPSSKMDELMAMNQKLMEQNQRLQEQLNQLLNGRGDAAIVQSKPRPAAMPILDAAALNKQGLAAFAAGDFHQAIRLFATAQRAGDVDAANNLAMIYLQGQGTAQDIPKAIELFRFAADAGHATAASNLGYLYDHGIGVRQDSTRALVWYTRAREGANRPQRRLADAGMGSDYF